MSSKTRMRKRIKHLQRQLRLALNPEREVYPLDNHVRVFLDGQEIYGVSRVHMETGSPVFVHSAGCEDIFVQLYHRNRGTPVIYVERFPVWAIKAS